MERRAIGIAGCEASDATAGVFDAISGLAVGVLACPFLPASTAVRRGRLFVEIQPIAVFEAQSALLDRLHAWPATTPERPDDCAKCYAFEAGRSKHGDTYEYHGKGEVSRVAVRLARWVRCGHAPLTLASRAVFTGLVESLGTIREIVRSQAGARLSVSSSVAGLEIGDSIAVSGTCLTVVARDAANFSADVSVETLERTTLGELSVGAAVNLERAATLGSPLGGHLVTGHVDGVARVVRVDAVGDSRRVSFEVPGGLGRYIAEKGSVCVDGVSLTVNAVSATTFDVMIIPHTLSVTTLGQIVLGSRVNLEIDLLARYVARWLEFQNGPATS